MKKDVVIIGAGPAGLSFALSLAGSGLKVLIVEKLAKKALANPPPDGRDIALTHRSRKILKQLGVWEAMDQSEIFPLREAKVLDGNSPYVLHFDNQQVEGGTLGFLVSNHLIRKALYQQAISLENIEIVTGQTVTDVQSDSAAARVTVSSGQVYETSLVVAADSRFSGIRRKLGISASMHDFGRVAIVCRMQHTQANQGIAYECFHYGQTLAILPLSEKESSIVLTAPTQKADRLMKMDEQQFNRRVQEQFDGRLGDMLLSSKRFSYPLVAVWANRFQAQRFALIGDAAVGMHPVTAHGFNLGLRSAYCLAVRIKKAAAADQDIASEKLLKRYQAKHRLLARPIYSGTNAIVRLFTNDLPLHRMLRKLALRLGNHIRPLNYGIKRQLTDDSLRG